MNEPKAKAKAWVRVAGMVVMGVVIGISAYLTAIEAIDGAATVGLMTGALSGILLLAGVTNLGKGLVPIAGGLGGWGAAEIAMRVLGLGLVLSMVAGCGASAEQRGETLRSVRDKVVETGCDICRYVEPFCGENEE